MENKIDLNIFKMLVMSATEQTELESMGDKLTQLLVATMGIKGCTIFVLNPEIMELETLASSGLSPLYLNKGPVMFKESMGLTPEKGPVVIKDVANTDKLQYPESAKEEGIGAIVSVPVFHTGKVIGVFRMYHHEVWDIGEEDLETLQVLSNIIGLALIHGRLLTGIRSVKNALNEIHPMWLET